MPEIRDEASQLIEIVAHALPKRMDGRETILKMREADFQWRQMEWIGFALEFLTRLPLVEAGFETGPTSGRTTFDVSGDFVWDLKAHPEGKSLILNDKEAIDTCVVERGAFGVVVVSATVEIDEDGSFYRWHEDLKGGTSAYTRRREARGGPSRRRKTAFMPKRVDALWFESMVDLAEADGDGWLGGFQEGMRNSNDRPRRPKYLIRNLDRARQTYSKTIGIEVD